MFDAHFAHIRTLDVKAGNLKKFFLKKKVNKKCEDKEISST